MYEAGVPLVTCRGSNSGMVLWADGPLWVSNNAMAIVPHNGQRKFAYYSLLHRPPYSTVSGSAQPQITRTALSPFECFWPDDRDQERIADALTGLDEKIDLNRRMNETLEGMAQAIFRDWFVDFGPTRRKAAGEADPVAIMGGLTPDPARAAELAAFFPAAFGNDGLPVGWLRRTVESIMELAYGKALPKTVRKDGPYPVYGSGGISGTHSSPLTSGPGIIVGRKGTVGSLYWEAGDFFAIDTVFYVVPKDGVQLNFAWYLLQTLGLENMNTDAAVPGLNRGNAYRLEFAYGGAPLLEAFEALVGPLRARQDASNAETQTLAETRDYLLPRLMSGAVRVAPKVEAA
jgi:type I restriction enzyme S subunit